MPWSRRSQAAVALGGRLKAGDVFWDTKQLDQKTCWFIVDLYVLWFQIMSSSFGHLLQNPETARLPEDSKGCLAVAGLRVCTRVGFCAQPQLLCSAEWCWVACSQLGLWRLTQPHSSCGTATDDIYLNSPLWLPTEVLSNMDGVSRCILELNKWSQKERCFLEGSFQRCFEPWNWLKLGKLGAPYSQTNPNNSRHNRSLTLCRAMQCSHTARFQGPHHRHWTHGSTGTAIGQF